MNVRRDGERDVFWNVLAFIMKSRLEIYRKVLLKFDTIQIGDSIEICRIAYDILVTLLNFSLIISKLRRKISIRLFSITLPPLGEKYDYFYFLIIASWKISEIKRKIVTLYFFDTNLKIFVPFLYIFGVPEIWKIFHSTKCTKFFCRVQNVGMQSVDIAPSLLRIVCSRKRRIQFEAMLIAAREAFPLPNHRYPTEKKEAQAAHNNRISSAGKRWNLVGFQKLARFIIPIFKLQFRNLKARWPLSTPQKYYYFIYKRNIYIRKQFKTCFFGVLDNHKIS